MPERSQNFLQNSEEKQFDESNDTKSLLKAKKEFTTASMKLMYQYATTKDYIFMSIAIISNAIFSCLPVILITRIGHVIDVMSTYRGDLDKFYDEEKDTAIVQFCLGAATVVLS